MIFSFYFLQAVGLTATFSENCLLIQKMNLKYIQLLMGGKNDKTWQTALHAFTE